MCKSLVALLNACTRRPGLTIFDLSGHFSCSWEMDSSKATSAHIIYWNSLGCFWPWNRDGSASLCIIGVVDLRPFGHR